MDIFFEINCFLFELLSKIKEKMAFFFDNIFIVSQIYKCEILQYFANKLCKYFYSSFYVKIRNILQIKLVNSFILVMSKFKISFKNK